MNLTRLIKTTIITSSIVLIGALSINAKAKTRLETWGVYTTNASVCYMTDDGNVWETENTKQLIMSNNGTEDYIYDDVILAVREVE